MTVSHPLLTVHRPVLRAEGASGVAIAVDRVHEHAQADQVVRPMSIRQGLLHAGAIYRAPLGISLHESVQVVDVVLRPTAAAWAFLVEVLRVDLTPSRELVAFFRVGVPFHIPSSTLTFEFWLRPPSISDSVVASLPVAVGEDKPDGSGIALSPDKHRIIDLRPQQHQVHASVAQRQQASQQAKAAAEWQALQPASTSADSTTILRND